MSTAVELSRTESAVATERRNRIRSIVETVIPLLALLGLIAYFSVASSYFFTKANFLTMTQLVGPLLLVALGATFVIVMGSIDLSVGSTALLSGSVTALLISNNNYGMKTIPIALAVGGTCGLINGVAFAYGRVPSFIVTLGTLSAFRGLGLRMINGSPIQFNDLPFSNLAIGQAIPSVANFALWAIVVWVIAMYLNFRTKFGRYMYAIGGNERVARLSGIPVDRYKVYAFMLSGMTAALAGLLSVGQLSSADPTLGSTFLLDSLAAIVVGGTALSGGVGGVHRTLLGVLIISVLDDGLNLMGVDEFTQEIIKGAVIVFAAAVVMFNLRKMIVK